MFEKKWGIPIVTMHTLQLLQRDPSLQAWHMLTPVENFDTYRTRELTKEQRSELRFAPPIEVVTLQNPNGGLFRGFRTRLNDWATTFVLVNDAGVDYVVAVAEWKHGAATFTLVPPSGVPSKADNGDMAACAKREFVEESGIELESVVRLVSSGLPIATRSLTTRYYPFIGFPKMPIVVGPSKLDANEHLKLVLIPLSDWLKMVVGGHTQEECAVSITFLALNYLGRLSVSLQ